MRKSYEIAKKVITISLKTTTHVGASALTTGAALLCTPKDSKKFKVIATGITSVFIEGALREKIDERVDQFVDDSIDVARYVRNGLRNAKSRIGTAKS